MSISDKKKKYERLGVCQETKAGRMKIIKNSDHLRLMCFLPLQAMEGADISPHATWGAFPGDPTHVGY